MQFQCCLFLTAVFRKATGGIGLQYHSLFHCKNIFCVFGLLLNKQNKRTVLGVETISEFPF